MTSDSNNRTNEKRLLARVVVGCSIIVFLAVFVLPAPQDRPLVLEGLLIMAIFLAAIAIPSLAATRPVGRSQRSLWSLLDLVFRACGLVVSCMWALVGVCAVFHFIFCPQNDLPLKGYRFRAGAASLMCAVAFVGGFAARICFSQLKLSWNLFRHRDTP